MTTAIEIPVAGRLSRPAGLWLITIMTATIAVCDLAAKRYNLGALYMVPFILATQYVRGSKRLLLLAVGMVILNYLAMALAYFPTFKPDITLRLRLINRSFVTVAIIGAATLVVFYLRGRDYWFRRHARMAPTDEEVSLLLQVFQMFEDIIAVLAATMLAGGTFIADFFTPRALNFPILYLMPLAVVAITRSRLLLWIAVPILLVLAYIGYFCGPGDNFDLDTVHHIAINRELSVSAIVLAAGLFHLFAAPHKLGKAVALPNA